MQEWIALLVGMAIPLALLLLLAYVVSLPARWLGTTGRKRRRRW
jgi:hypothetical protein